LSRTRTPSGRGQRWATVASNSDVEESRRLIDLRNQAENTTDPDEAAFLFARADTVQSNECSGSVNIIAKNNPDLKPERSLSKSLGAVFQMNKHWSASIDWWSINRKNEINLKSVQDLLTAESSNADGDRRGQICFAEQQCRDRAIVNDERFGRLWQKTGLVQEHEHTEADERDGDDGRACSGIVVLERDHAALRLGGGATAVNE